MVSRLGHPDHLCLCTSQLVAEGMGEEQDAGQGCVWSKAHWIGKKDWEGPHGWSNPVCCYCKLSMFSPGSICLTPPTNHKALPNSLWQTEIISGKYQKPQTAVIKSRRDWKHWPCPAVLERLGISLNKTSQVTQASNLIIGVSTKIQVICVFERSENWWQTGAHKWQTGEAMGSSQCSCVCC